MFYIQRASAGSGKTYTLTKKFILHLIANKSHSGKWFLRNEKEIEDKMSSVLAITFTNKATNEMKERIVGKLSELAKAVDKENLTSDFISKTDYLEEFAKLTLCSPQEVGKACKTALNAILNNYSLFKVSTIDSFFQEILRTFAYEANVNDSFQIEIDSEYVNKSALDLTLQELDTNPEKMGNSAFWMKILMGRTSETSYRWNVFSKSEDKKSIYSKIKEALKRLENEDYKAVKQSLDQYFSKPDSSQKLMNLYHHLKKEGEDERIKVLSEIRNLISLIDSQIGRENLPKEAVNSYYYRHKAKIDQFDIDSLVDFKLNFVLKEDGSLFNQKFKGKYPAIETKAKELYNKLDDWNNWEIFPFYTAWNVYGELLPYMGLVLEISKRMQELLESNNTIKLSDTNYILRKIIGDDDTPFVYERMGNYINNFLIDEFQDTSEMQWQILKPLLTNGEANGQDCLIIGDPKQSIYRFRNAKYSLILHEAPDTFHERELLGLKKEENTNWRSHGNIVRFNNFFFKSLAKELSVLNNKKGNIEDIEDLYSNVVQYPHNQEQTGYIEIRFSNESESESNEDEENTQMDDFEIGNLISSLRERGYKQKDIAVLVSSNVKGREIIESIMEYNQTQASEDKISFISEESLYISKSKAVQIIIGVFEKIADKNFVGTPSSDDNSKKSIPWAQIRLNFHLYSLQNQEMDPSERMLNFLKEDSQDDILTKLLSSLQMPTLTAIAEAVIDEFIDENLRKQDAIYIAGFQDLISEYNTKYPNDPTSFLEWWKAKGQYKSVSSPSGTDAVQVMTIHKSKGLEFKCVILPWASDKFIPDWDKAEWRWIKPQNPENKFDLPPFLPILTTSKLLESTHAESFKTYNSQIIIDKLNSYYVAFTRAKNELYILTKKKGGKNENLCKYLNLICNSNYGTDFFSDEEQKLILDPSSFIYDEKKNRITIGEKLSEKEIAHEYDEENSRNHAEEKILEGYFVNTNTPRLNFVSVNIEDTSEL